MLVDVETRKSNAWTLLLIGGTKPTAKLILNRKRRVYSRNIRTIDFHRSFGDSTWNQSLETVSDVRRGWSSISCVPEPAKTEGLYSRYECWRGRVKEDATEEVNLTTELFEECGMDEAVT